jgi:cold shock CspA family protein
MEIDTLKSYVEGFNADLPTGQVRTLEVNSYGELIDRGRHVAAAARLAVFGLTSIFSDVQIGLIEHEVGAAWPRCPTHGSHPLEPDVVGWECPTTEHSWPYGSIAANTPPAEPARADDEVRWMLHGWGLIAHHEGDLWFMHFPDLAEGQRVSYVVEPARQGLFRRAAEVMPVASE